MILLLDRNFWMAVFGHIVQRLADSCLKCSELYRAKIRPIAIGMKARGIERLPAGILRYLTLILGVMLPPLPSRTSIFFLASPKYLIEDTFSGEFPLVLKLSSMIWFSSRSEAIESLFVLYRITGNTELREAAWTMFQNIFQHTFTSYGNAAISDVTVMPPPQTDSMESFWTAETLKYFYLIFSEPDFVDLDSWVFNTEGHPFKRPV